jgi:hypothetical protein
VTKLADHHVCFGQPDVDFGHSRPQVPIGRDRHALRQFLVLIPEAAFQGPTALGFHGATFIAPVQCLVAVVVAVGGVRRGAPTSSVVRTGTSSGS